MSKFLIGSIILILVTHLYLYWRSSKVWATGTKSRVLCVLLLLLSGAAIGAGHFILRKLPETSSSIITMGIYTWLGFLGILLPLMFALEIPRLLYCLLGKIISASTGLPLKAHPTLAKVCFTLALITALVLTGISLHGGLKAPEVVDVTITSSQMPEKLNGMRIVQLTDIHLGAFARKAFVQETVERVNALKPDMVVITGDLFDGNPEETIPYAEPLKQLRAQHGVYFVTGNHEFIQADVSVWTEALKKLNVHPLENAHKTIKHNGVSFDLMGVDDWSASKLKGDRSCDLDKAQQGRIAKRFSILLAHQPKIIEKAADAGIDLVLCGHTHGGQFWPWSMLVSHMMPYVKGLHQHNERTQIYVSEGTSGWGPPLRLGSRTEITHLTLKSSKALKAK